MDSWDSAVGHRQYFQYYHPAKGPKQSTASDRRCVLLRLQRGESAKHPLESVKETIYRLSAKYREPVTALQRACQTIKCARYQCS